MAAKQINRITLFKIPNPADIPACVDAYVKLKQDAKKDGKPYILDVKAGPTVQDARNQGYTLAVTSVYASQADMDYYDNECAAHGELKKVVKTRVGGPPMVLFFENGV